MKWLNWQHGHPKKISPLPVFDNFISVSGVWMLKNQICQKSKAKPKKFVEKEEMAKLKAWAS